MKKYLALVISSFLLAGPVSAEKYDSEKSLAILTLANKLLLEAESLAMEQCATTRIVVPLPIYQPDYDTDKNIATVREGTIETSVAIEWSGGCVEGKRDGVGTLSWIREKPFPFGKDKIQTITFRSEGRFVKGQRLGMWCGTVQVKVTKKGVSEPAKIPDSFCSIMAGHTKPPLAGPYRKQPDGSWQEYVNGRPSDSSLAAGALEALSDKVLADAVSGKTDLKVELVAQSHALDDLVRGSKIVLAKSSTPISLKDKRVAIVLSSKTISELERFKIERQAFIDASAGLRGDAATHRAKFIQLSSPDRVLTNIVKVMKRHARDVQPADDLAGLKEGGFDYALVVDWKFKTRFDLLGKFNSLPIMPTDFFRTYTEGDIDKPESPVLAFNLLGGYLINRDLKAIMQFSAPPALSGSSVKLTMSDYDPHGDISYLSHLAYHYEFAWGRSVDKPGSLFSVLDGQLKAMQ